MNDENINNKQVTFNIYGTCVLRDIFGFREDENASNYKVLHFRQFSSPITWFVLNDKPVRNISLEFLANLQVDSMIRDNFSKNCVVDDYNKTVLQSYVSKSDYFLLDFAEARFSLINLTTNDGKNHYFTATERIYRKNKEGISVLDLLEGHKSIHTFEKFDTPDNIRKTCELLVDWLINKMGYKESQIILVESKNALSYIDGVGINEFPYKKALVDENAYIEKYNVEFKIYYLTVE